MTNTTAVGSMGPLNAIKASMVTMRNTVDSNIVYTMLITRMIKGISGYLSIDLSPSQLIILSATKLLLLHPCGASDIIITGHRGDDVNRWDRITNFTSRDRPFTRFQGHASDQDWISYALCFERLLLSTGDMVTY
jgi:hypothetical protein